MNYKYGFDEEKLLYKKYAPLKFYALWFFLYSYNNFFVETDYFSQSMLITIPLLP